MNFRSQSEIVDLISNIGGLLGLFLGVSFISIIEFFEAVFEVLRILLRTELRKNNLVEVKPKINT